ncbi:MAG TPA: glycosyltransferase family 39 protein [Polyangiaceae bacterium]|nr:glycosyltransferase family 39 protein [Polyangiaceae bacterium]
MIRDDSGPSGGGSGSGAERPVEGRRRIVGAWLTAAAVAVLSLLVPIASSGIWDPHELGVADLSRRIALTLMGAEGLSLSGGNNSVPSLGELGRGQLPFTSIATGFRVFGLHDWAGRLPLALWGLLGVAATYALVARLVSRKAACFSAVALATMPLYFLHARTMLGDVVTMAALAIAVAGLGVAALDDTLDTKGRTLWGAAGLVGLLSGFGARGLLVGVCVPALGVGLSWALLRLNRERLPFGARDVVGAAALAIGLLALGSGIAAVLRALAEPARFFPLVGLSIESQRRLPTFDFVIQHLGHGLFPWSAVIPFAIGRLLRSPPGASASWIDREGALRVLLLTVAAVCLGVQGALAPVTGHLPFAAVAPLAAIAGVALFDLERGASGSRAFAMTVAAFAILLYLDFENFPDKAFAAYAVDGRFPDSFEAAGTRWIRYATLGFIGLFFLSVMDRQATGDRRFDREEYLAWPRAVQRLWDGNLMFLLMVLESLLVGLFVAKLLSDWHFHLRPFERLPSVLRSAIEVAWIGLPVAVFVLPLAALFARDVSRAIFSPSFGLKGRGGARLGRLLEAIERRAPAISARGPSRGSGAVLAAAACGLVLSLGYYPALASQISPKRIFEAYRRFAAGGERLALLGVAGSAASYYTGGEAPAFDDAKAAFEWLMHPEERRWLAARASDLPALNALYRETSRPRANIPVLDAGSSEILLMSNRLEAGEQNRNPLSRLVVGDPPEPDRPLDAKLGEQLRALGWEVRTPQGEVVDGVQPGRPYEFVIYWEVLASISGSWDTFIHIDGFGRRFNGDHTTLEGKYPLKHWRRGDFIVDVHPITLEPNFTPGRYNVFYGLYSGSRRLEVKVGPQHENRIRAGTLQVR